ncbi:hypothetical protein RE9425_03100 [Prescottella equi]|nr:hypothetical protein RE9425_03100 [Prescottella equi]
MTTALPSRRITPDELAAHADADVTARIVEEAKRTGIREALIAELSSLKLAIDAIPDLVPDDALEVFSETIAIAFASLDLDIFVTGIKPAESLLRFADRLAPDDRLELAGWLIDSARKDPVGQRDAARKKAHQSIFRRLETLSSSEVGEILSSSGNRNRTIAGELRRKGKIIGLPSGSRPDYLYPAFQFDVEERRVKPLVEYANQHILPVEDPFGAASWWLLNRSIFGGNSALDHLEDGTLTEKGIDNVLKLSNRGM